MAMCRAFIHKNNRPHFVPLVVSIPASTEIFDVLRDQFRLDLNNEGVLINWLKTDHSQSSLLDIASRRITVANPEWRNRLIKLYMYEPGTDVCHDTGNSIEFRFK
jgi:hypothetical protein